MNNAIITNIDNSTRIIPDDGYSIKFKQADGSYTYSDGFVQIPNSRIDEVLPNIEVIPSTDVPPEPMPEEDVPVDVALDELTEVILK